MSTGRWWLVVTVVCALCAGVIAAHWWAAIRTYAPASRQLVTNDDVRAYLDGHPYADKSGEPRVEVPTGVFVQSLRFQNASDVNVTGYIWQIYDTVRDAGLLDDSGHFTDAPGFVLSEQVDSGNTTIEEAYRRTEGTRLTIGWYVDVTLRQPFDYARYPLDKHNVWLRLWHRAFDRNIVLVPDLAAYDDTGVGVAFGLDDKLVPGGWQIEETYFYYESGNYDTDFGIRDYVGKRGFPELHFDVVVARHFVNAFVIHLIPLMVVIALLFSVVMTVTMRGRQAEVFGFSTSGALGTSSALFFVVLLAHIQLREQLASAGVVYLEWFYLVTYVAILMVSLEIYLFTAGRAAGWDASEPDPAAAGPRERTIRAMRYGDNELAKLAFLPAIMVALALITLWFF